MMRSLTLTQWLFGAYAGSALLLLGLGHAAAGSPVIGAILLCGPLAALIGSVLAVRALPKSVEIPWIIFALAACAQIAGQLANSTGHAAGDSFSLLALISAFF